MYLTVISFKNGKTIPIQSEIPLSADKVVPGFMVITDEVNGQILSFRGEEIVTISSALIKDDEVKISKKRDRLPRKRPNFTVNK